MKARMNIKSIMLMALACVFIVSSVLFINMSKAATNAKVTVETANIRKTPTTDALILEQVSKGTQLEVLEQSGDWYKVKYNKIVGYLRNDLVEVDTNAEVKENTTTEVTTTTEDNENNENTSTDVNKETLNKTYIVKKQTELKVTPLINSLCLKQLNVNDEVTFVKELITTGKLEGWAIVTTSDGINGWIRLENLEVKTENQEAPKTTTPVATTETKTMYVNSQTVNVRENANQSSKVVTQLKINAEVQVLSTENGWCHIKANNVEGYIAERLLSATKQATSRSEMNTRTVANTNTNKTTTSTQSTSNVVEAKNITGSGSTVIEYAKSLLGCKYVYGGTSPKGFDCSGFTQYVYKHFGVSINRTAQAQFSNGTSVKELQTGDLVMFGSSTKNIWHVGIYISNNTFIHAANPSRGVTTDSLASGYYKNHFVGARRVK